jgi:hypothetical protein
LESLKPLCGSIEEFATCSNEAEQILLNDGFRPARDYVVRLHDQFRERAKEAEEAEADAAL